MREPDMEIHDHTVDQDKASARTENEDKLFYSCLELQSVYDRQKYGDKY